MGERRRSFPAVEGILGQRDRVIMFTSICFAKWIVVQILLLQTLEQHAFIRVTSSVTAWVVSRIWGVFLPHHRSKQCGCLPALPTGVYSSSSSAVWRTCSFFSRQSHPDNLKEPSFPIWTEPCVLIWKFLVWLSHSSFSRNGTCTYLHLVMTVLWIFVADQNEGSLQDLSDHSLGSAFRILLISFIGNGIENLK